MKSLPTHFDDWVAKYFDEHLDPNTHQELEASLLASEEARTVFCQTAATQSDLVRALGVPDPEVPKSKPISFFKPLAWAAAAVLLLSITLPFLLQTTKPFEVVGTDTSVAMPSAAGSYRVIEDTEIELQKGLFLQFSAGTLFTLQDRPANGRQPVDLQKGILNIRVDKPHPGVVLHTPVGKLQDIGTTFEVEVDDGSNRVFAEVTDGKVVFTPKDPDQDPQTLTPNQGRIELSASSELGHVIDREGNGTLRPFLGSRWSAAQMGMPIKAKDWLKTGRRGANALKIRLRNGTEIILGPDSLIEMQSATQLTVHRGEFQIKAPEKAQLTVQGPEGIHWTLENETAIGRVTDQNMQKLSEAPGWLKGYLSDDSTEAMGSLMAKVDGRNVPLTMGYHKVTVDIRDQIARTVIEESFINHTHQVLEGIFYFPLPADASISEFGMWIGDELVHGEIVEKQRAREIYETILREKRDPGLLEWSGGNLFKARVYPIVGEKRIKIGYTQVLPKLGNRYTYRYGLQGDLFRQYPLKELHLNVRVHSAETLQGVFSPSHLCRTDLTPHAAVVDYQAEEVVPERDFVLHIDTQAEGSALRVIPHRRGKDGYFMMMLQAPDTGEPKTRPLLPPADPMQLVVMVDTSGSVAGPTRTAALNFLSAFLNGLGDQDRVQVMTFDTEARWVTDAFSKMSPANRLHIMEEVEKRNPLGWSDLDLAFSEVQKRIQAPAQVIVISDGIPTTRDADAQAWIERLSRMKFDDFTFHAVAPGNQYEAAVLKAMAGQGSGSWRRVDSEDPSATADSLLNELTTPAVKNLNIQFKGLDVAAVYPEQFPNLPVGSQQRIVGRYDATAGPQEGEVTVTGTFAGKPVSYSAKIELSSAEEGNSFIPRLWARSHLDMLLEQGRSPEIQEQIISLSEDYQIMTPYTSFLVLESEADRERFAVQKKFRMRDGENFFAEGRDSATYALRRKQMLQAKTWRKQLYQQMRQDLNRMGRDPLQASVDYPVSRLSSVSGYDAFGGGGGDRFGGGGEGVTGGLRFFDLKSNINGNYPMDWSGAPSSGQNFKEGKEEILFEAEPSTTLREIISGRALPQPINISDPNRIVKRRLERVGNAPMRLDQRGPKSMFTSEASRRSQVGRKLHSGRYMPNQVQINVGFPTLSQRNIPILPETWNPEIRALLSKLDRRSLFRESVDGFQLKQRVHTLDANGKGIPQGEAELLIQGSHWWTRSLHNPGAGYQAEWNSETEQGIVDATWRLGRIHTKEKDQDLAFLPPFPGYFGNRLQGMVHREVSMQKDGAHVLLHFTTRSNPVYQEIWIIDPVRSLLLEISSLQDEKITNRIVFSDFKEISNFWWPGRIEYLNAQDQLYREELIELSVDSQESIRGEIARLRTSMLKDAVVLSSELPSAMDARNAFKSGTATLEHCWVLLLDALIRQRSDIAASYWPEFETRTTGTPGLTRIRLMYLQQTRRLEAYHSHLLSMANTLRTTPGEVDYSRAIELMQFSQQAALAPQERKEILDVLEPVLRRQTGIQKPMLQWFQNLLTAYDALGQPEKALEMSRILAELDSDQSYNHTQYAQRLVQQGEINTAIQYLRESLPQHPDWSSSDIRNIHSTIATFLWQERRLDALIDHVELLEPSQASTQIWSIYLSALIAHNEYDQAMAWMQSKVGAVVQGNHSAEAKAAYLAAINRLSGNGYDHSSNRVTEKNSRTLKEIVLQLLPLENMLDLIQPIVTDYRFKRSAHAVALWKEMYVMLQAQVEDGNPEKIFSLIQWLKGAGFQPDQADGWDKLMDRIFVHWKPSGESGKNTLGSVLLTYGNLDLQLKQAHIFYQRAETQTAKQNSSQYLFNLLLQKPWSDEVMSVFPIWLSRLDLSADDSARIYTQKWVDWVIDSRKTHLISLIDNRHQLSRRELNAATQSIEEENHLWVLQWLRGQEVNPPQPEMKRWIQLDRAYVQVLTETDLPAIEAEGRALLRDLLAQSPETPTESGIIFINRWVGILSNIAVKMANGSTESLPLLALLEEADQKDSFEMDWKLYIYRLLLALDRGDELEAQLRQWYASDDLELRIQWGNAYAMILAERNQIENAVKVFENLKAENVLNYQDYRTLSDWYTVLDKRELAKQNKQNAWNELQEYEIQNWLYQEVNRFHSSSATEVPEEMNPEIPDAFCALFRKSVNPGNYLWLLQRFYTSTRDFRLLSAVVESTIGQSQQGIYNYLGAMHQVLNLLQEEATLDKMLDQMETLRTQNLTQTDQRALHLLSFMISYQAAKQAQGATPHVDRAFDALQQAFKGEWAEGEAVQMAAVLAGLGALTPEKLAVEQQRQLNSLRNQVTKGSRDHLLISRDFAGVLWAANKQEAAVQLLESSLGLRRDANGGKLMIDEVSTLNVLSSYYISLSRFQQAEDLWIKERKLNYPHRSLQEMYRYLTQVCESALAQNGTVSLGTGLELYRNLQSLYLNELSGEVDINMSTHWVQALCNLWREGNRKQFKSVPDDAQRFAFSIFPKLLQRTGYFNGQSMISTVAETLHDINGSGTALEFLIQRAENEPEGLKELQNDFWQSHGYQIARWRHESAKHLSISVESRLLTLVLDALRDELENQQNRNRSIYWRNHSYYWSEKNPEFIATALEVLDAFPDSESHQLYIADYLFRGLDQEKLATDRLMQAYNRGILSWEGIYTLTGYLESGSRYAEAVRILPSLIDERPDHMDVQTRLIRCLEGTGETKKALSQLAETDAYFRSGNRWAEPHAVSLAKVSLDIKQYLKSAAYYDEAIAMHVKTNPDRGVGNGVLSEYYKYQSQAYQNLGDTDKAIDAIAGAIVSWGPDQNERNRALNRLDDIIRNAKDLDAYITRFEQEVAATGLDNPILRKALGKFFLHNGEIAKGIPHLRQAIALQPDDKETRDMLLESYSRNDQPNEAIALLLDTLIRNPHDLQNYQDLAKRYQQTEQPLETERAYTSMVEVMPQESESHEALALVREKQSNWEEALVQWENVIRIRSKEPAGYLGKLRTLIQLERLTEAREVFDHLIKTEWPEHFGKVKQQAETLMGQAKP